jgi:VanZ family protein
VLIILLVGLLALGDEIHQSFVPMRRASSLDVILDVTGGFLSQVAMMLRKKDRS